MVGFFIKKAFFDGWDHLFGLVALNAGFLILALGAAASLAALSSQPLVLLVIGGIFFALVLTVFFSTCVHALKEVADYGEFSLATFRSSLRAGLVPGLQAGGLAVGGGGAIGFAASFYLRLGGVLGAAAAGFLFWVALALILALQWYLPVRARLGGSFGSAMKKSLFLALDNPGFSFFLVIYNVLGLALSLITAFLLPGLAGAALALDGALKLRLRKYVWLEGRKESEAGAKERRIPWEKLLEEEAELLGTRSLREMVFPWKYR